jgi:hypothetical protein
VIGDHVAYAFALSVLSTVGIVLLALTGHPVPTTLDTIAVGTAVGGAALARGPGQPK